MNYREEVVAKAIDKFKRKYPEFDKNKFIEIAENGNYENFSLLATVIHESSYRTVYVGDNYDDIKEIRKAMNKRVDQILEYWGILSIYDFLIHEHNYELWNGDQKYMLFCIGSAIPYEVINGMIYSVILFHEFFGRKNIYLSIDSIKRINDICRGRLIFVGDGIYNDGTYNEQYRRTEEQKYKVQKTHCEKLRYFAHLIWDQKFEDAYLMINEKKKGE